MTMDRGPGAAGRLAAGRGLPGQGQINPLEYLGLGQASPWQQAAAGNRRILQPGVQRENQLGGELGLLRRGIQSETTTPIPTAGGELMQTSIGDLIRQRTMQGPQSAAPVLVSQGQQGNPTANILQPAQTVGEMLQQPTAPGPIAASYSPPPRTEGGDLFPSAIGTSMPGTNVSPRVAANRAAYEASQAAGLQQYRDQFITAANARAETFRAENAARLQEQQAAAQRAAQAAVPRAAPPPAPISFAPAPAAPAPYFAPPAPQAAPPRPQPAPTVAAGPPPPPGIPAGQQNLQPGWDFGAGMPIYNPQAQAPAPTGATYNEYLNNILGLTPGGIYAGRPNLG